MGICSCQAICCGFHPRRNVHELCVRRGPGPGTCGMVSRRREASPKCEVKQLRTTVKTPEGVRRLRTRQDTFLQVQNYKLISETEWKLFFQITYKNNVHKINLINKVQSFPSPLSVFLSVLLFIPVSLCPSSSLFLSFPLPSLSPPLHPLPSLLPTLHFPPHFFPLYLPPPSLLIFCFVLSALVLIAE